MNVVCAVSLQEVPELKNLLSRRKDLERRWFTPSERASVLGKKSPNGASGGSEPCIRLSARLAAKKAFFSALRQAGCPSVFGPRDIEVANLKDGRPVLRPKGSRLKRFFRLNVDEVYVSLSHTQTLGCAVVALRMKSGAAGGERR